MCMLSNIISNGVRDGQISIQEINIIRYALENNFFPHSKILEDDLNKFWIAVDTTINQRLIEDPKSIGSLKSVVDSLRLFGIKVNPISLPKNKNRL